MWDVFTLLAGNLGVSFEVAIILMWVFSSMLWYAQDFRIGILLTFFTSALGFIMMYALELNYTAFAILMMMSLVILAFSIYVSASNNSNQGVFI